MTQSGGQSGAAGPAATAVVLDAPAPAATVAPTSPARSAAAPAGRTSALLEQVIDQTGRGTADWLGEFLSEQLPHKALNKWLKQVAPGARPATSAALSRLLGVHIAALDETISRQINEILHSPAFQKLEASWRGLKYLVEQVESDRPVKVRVLNVTWGELSRDIDRAVEFDASQMFRKIYEEFDTPGAEPFSVVVGDYAIKPSQQDMAALTGMSQVAAAAFAPFITAADPEMLALSSYSQIDRPTDLEAVFRGPDYLKWRAFRETEDSRFVGLTLPRVLMRTPYSDDNSRADGFRFREEVEGPDNSKYLWGNASYAFASVLIRSFCESGWLADIRGFQRDIVTGGLVTGLPVHSFGTDKTGIATKTSTDVAIGDLREKELGDLGFIPLCHCKDTDYCVFYGNQSAQKPKVYDRTIASTNARISAMLQYILCASRFAHYLKVRVRDRIGSMTDEVVMQTELRNWITQYVANDSQASPEVRARFPLREAEVRVYPKRDNPGVYGCEMHLMPHAQLDMLAVGVKLTMAELSRTRR